MAQGEGKGTQNVCRDGGRVCIMRYDVPEHEERTDEKRISVISGRWVENVKRVSCAASCSPLP